jgi:hypothetical protein
LDFGFWILDFGFWILDFGLKKTAGTPFQPERKSSAVRLIMLLVAQRRQSLQSRVPRQ